MHPASRQFFPAAWRWWALCLVSLTLLLYWRRPDAFYNPQFWAEDGTVFFAQARLQARPLLNVPYAGYYHVLARATAYVGNGLPLAWVPHWYALASWLLLVGLVTYLFSARFTLPLWQRCLLGLALVAVPVDNEVFFNIANWATLTTVGWLLLVVAQEPRTRWEIVFDFGLLTLLGLNSPFTICLWPLFFLRWAVRRQAASGGLAVASLVVAIGQVANMSSRLYESTGPGWPLPAVFVDIVLYRVGYMFLGGNSQRIVWTAPGRLAGLAGVALALGVFLFYSARQRRWAVWSWLWGGLMCGLLSLFVVRAAPPASLFPHAGRHFFLPVLCLAWALIGSPTRWKWPGLALILSAFLFWTPWHKNEVRPDLQWAVQVAACATNGWWVNTPCPVPINPREPAGWVVWIPAPAQVPPLVTGPEYIYLPIVKW